jgi:malonyl CoA-acyl carrier protein transacylase
MGSVQTRRQHEALVAVHQAAIIDFIASFADQALRVELMLTPKPGLVDQRNSGAHHDMDVQTFLTSGGGRALYDADPIREDLATSIAHPVRWFDALEVMRELGTNLFIEMAPGHVSTNLVAESIPGVRAISIADRGLRYAAVVAARENRGS